MTTDPQGSVLMPRTTAGRTAGSAVVDKSAVGHATGERQHKWTVWLRVDRQGSVGRKQDGSDARSSRDMGQGAGRNHRRESRGRKSNRGREA